MNAEIIFARVRPTLSLGYLYTARLKYENDKIKVERKIRDKWLSIYDITIFGLPISDLNFDQVQD